LSSRSSSQAPHRERQRPQARGRDVVAARGATGVLVSPRPSGTMDSVSLKVEWGLTYTSSLTVQPVPEEGNRVAAGRPIVERLCLLRRRTGGVFREARMNFS